MAALTVQTIVSGSTGGGTQMTYAAGSTATTTFPNDGNTFLHMKNTGASKTVTILTNATSIQQTGVGIVSLGNYTVTLSSLTGDKMVGPFPTGRWNNGSGSASFTMSSATGVTVAAVSLPRTI